MTKTNSTKYTYTMLANDVIALLNGEIELTELPKAAMLAKATDLLNAQANKAAYNAAHKAERAPKGASEETKAKAAAIKSALSGTPMTTAEINAALGKDFTALQVANAVKYIEGAKSCKVVRETVNGKGLKSEKEYTAYFIG